MGTIFRLLRINISCLALILLSIEIILSDYSSKRPALDVPWTKAGFALDFKPGQLSHLNVHDRVRYSRDTNGYRPYIRSSHYILTIGGSTTDQLFVDDDNTYQRTMEKILGVGVLNGGVDGQSSYGHTRSLALWHSRVLPKKKISHILLLVGINDVRLLEANDYRLSADDNPRLSLRLRQFLSNRSFFYPRMSRLLYSTRFVDERHLDNTEFISGHGGNLNTVKREWILQKIPYSSSSSYRLLFKQLIITAMSTFPDAKIVIVQQQAPMCHFVDGLYADKSGGLYTEFCGKLGLVFNEQRKALQNIDIKNVRVVEMYKDTPLVTGDFYDTIHTNAAGSQALGLYLASKF